MVRCPICDAAAKPRRENASFPFCSTRCKTIDLGKWLNEEYRIPVAAVSDDEEAQEPKSAPETAAPVRN
jgi:endogenous inhibitor of DNA gyrase (YacG/DUF329 family)